MRIPSTHLQPQCFNDVVKAVRVALVTPGILFSSSIGFLHFFKPDQSKEKLIPSAKEAAISEKDIVTNFLMPQP